MRFGVDEAGKGPVLGSMFAAAVRVDPAVLPADVGDSKDVLPDRRAELAAAIREAGRVGVAEVGVAEIDDPETDMNTLTVEAHARALEEARAGGGSAVVDAGDTNAVRFGTRLSDRLDGAVDVRAEHGADETDAVVGAASIVAKVARDAHIEALSAKYGPLGSGYPSDPTTRAFLERYVDSHGDLPPCARTSWQTSADVLAAASQASLDRFE